MRKTSLMLFALSALAGASIASSAAVAKDDKQACIKKEQAKGTSACIAKAKCDGVTSRKDQARMCG